MFVMHSARFYPEGEFEAFGAYCLSSLRFKTRRDRSHVDSAPSVLLDCLLSISFSLPLGLSFRQSFTPVSCDIPSSGSLIPVHLLYKHTSSIRPVLCLRCSFCVVLCRYLLLHARIHACCPCPCRCFRSLPSYLVTDLFFAY